jgi:cell fate (sporulation/competence/biofilm development) regulator YlbF (YheA/YmcA/DUF963 family)
MNETLQRTLDVNELLSLAAEIADMIKNSEETVTYLQLKQQMNADDTTRTLFAEFAKKRQAFMECEKYGHFHPDYNRSFDEAVAVQDQLERLESVSQFRLAEQRLDELFFDVSKVIASSVSESIMVPNNIEEEKNSGCGDGSCSGKCS